MVKIHNERIGPIEVVAIEYTALISAKDSLVHLSEHAGQTLSQWKTTLSGGATDYPLMAKDCLPHIEEIQAKMGSLLDNPPANTSTDQQTPTVSKYNHELMDIGHHQLVNDLAKYKKLVTHLNIRLFKLEGEWNEREWPVVVLHGSEGGQTLRKVEALCVLTDAVTGVEYKFSRFQYEHQHEHQDHWPPCLRVRGQHMPARPRS